jgi:YD repeat-containing protein
MKYNKLFILFTLLIACNTTAIGQQKNNGLSVYRLKPNVNPATPAQAELGRFKGEEVTSFTGLPNIQIPLYQIKLKGLELPITMNYDNSGVKVNSEASWVGLGWSLDAGGVISRSKNGFPDDIWRINYPISKDLGFILNHGQAANEFTDTGVSQDEIRKQLASIEGYLTKKADGTYVGFNQTPDFDIKSDTQPDLFSYRFAGKSGKFVFGADQKIKLLQYEPYQFDYTIDDSGNPLTVNIGGVPQTSKGLISIKITDENGNKYTFSDLEKVQEAQEGLRIRTLCDLDPDAPNITGEPYARYTTAWYLTEIETFIGEKITFTYETEDIISGLVQTTERNRDLTNNSEQSDVSGTYGYGFRYSKVYTKGKRLSIIETPYETISFIANNLRTDVKNSHILSAIQVVSKHKDEFITQIHFDYDYFQSDVNEKTLNALLSSERGNLYQRLKLTSLRTVKSDVSISKYDFLYNESQPLPAKFSFQQDFWGYYNANGAKNLFPKLFVCSNLYAQDRFSILQLKNIGDPDYFVIEGANRNCNPNTIALGTLQRITYPTGGYSEYEYEPHDFLYQGLYFKGGGLRVKKVSDYDGISHANDIIKNYKYVQSSDPTKSSGIVYDLPIFGYLENNCAIDYTGTGGDHQVPPNYPRNSYNYFKYNMVRADNPMSIQGFGDAVNVGYSEIKEETSGAGYSWSKYSSPVKYGDQSDALYTGCALADYGYCDGLYNVPAIKNTLAYDISIGVIIPDQLADFVGQDLSPNSYPFIPNSNYDWNRGLLMNKRIFSASGALKTNIDYKYTIFSPSTGMYTVNGFYYSNGNNYNIRPSNYSNTMTGWTEAVIYYNKYKILTNVNKLLSSEEKTDYFSGTPVITKTNNSYSNHRFLNSTSVTDSRGDIKKVYYRYPFDLSSGILGYVTGPVNPISYLVQNNNIATPVQTTNSVIVNGSQEKITFAKVVRFGQSAFSKVVPIWESYLESPAPIPEIDFQNANLNWNEDGDEVFNQDPKLQQEFGFSKYDAKSNLLEYTDHGYRSNAFQWGYNNKYVTAGATNAKSSDIFYDGFEDLTVSGLSAYDNSKTGHYSKLTGYNKNLSGLTNGIYILEYWRKVNNLWTLERSNNINVTNSTYNISINTSYQIDDVRFYPLISQMTTYTYDPMVGVTSVTDPNELIVYYEYDDFQRLINIKDRDGNIVKHTDYHYKGQ